jgi:hypothetical protein
MRSSRNHALLASMWKMLYKMASYDDVDSGPLLL